MVDDAEPRESPIDESRLSVRAPKRRAVGIPGVAHALQISLKQMGPVRSAETLLRVNQKTGFDCPGCAWPESDKRHVAEFCENGAKAVAEEATLRTVTAAFFAEHPLSELETWDDFALGQQGRLTEPMLLEEGATHYRPVGWDEALDLVAEELRACASPDEAIFYTSGRTSNEAAFVYQLLVRGFGTNNLPDCSNMCHESSGSALTETIGIGKGSVSLRDVERAPLLIVAGQNPGTNHPRMLTALERAKRAGSTIVAVNPLPEAGLLRFQNPQTVRGTVGEGTVLADHFLQVRLGGDQALFQGLGKALLDAEEARGDVFDHAFIRESTEGLDAYLDELRTTEWSEIERGGGIDEARIRAVAELIAAAEGTVVCWAMGLTQHAHSVATLKDVVNVLLLTGNIGKPGAGVCPVRGHSNVQGDRTMGIFERMPDSFHDALDREFSFASPREHGTDTVAAIRAMRDGRARVFVGLGGNFARATPDSGVTEAAMRSLALTVHISTKLNRSHVVTGRRALILPTLGRTDADVQVSGEQRVTVEDSMSAVHASRGRLRPPSPALRSEVAILTALAERVLADRENTPRVDWAGLRGDYRLIRAHIARVVPGFEGFEQRIEVPGGFVLPHPPRDSRSFDTASGLARFTANPLEYPLVPEGRLLLQTLRSHDQFNTTIYGRDDRYRGIHDGRRVVFVHADDIAALGFANAAMVDLVSEWPDGVERRAEAFRIVAYDTPRGCAAAYYPETNVLVPLDSTARVSNTPTSKSVVIRLEPAA
ncbi:FdhF/YdeP family oxidoreductase [Rathayibacter tanaceti]|uniref:FdhF/YdeP family oxidoreductase n=2 Tax=Rathayibacter tanaceti TaxID=1671680 RepID=A0A166HL12_9MICO|nr:FdhF/YdeP family oxidoreductase [Rathayibacter tanaceti]KZX20801.1 putative formate dehydrogenase [Rathayibacter tanaceti]QHC54892.1 FdhF/YdeP family oxidoreductase [Rathayibacter tanaceti]TCO38429.1 molybdopterin-dependent oxidoreductase alpha subunit [Rathayibacter tanaceti]